MNDVVKTERVDNIFHVILDRPKANAIDHGHQSITR